MNNIERKKITHLIVGLGLGGAESMLYQLMLHSSLNNFHIKVISLGQGDYFTKKIQDLGVDVVTLNIKKRPISTLINLKRIIANSDTLSCWMYHSNLIGLLLFGRKKNRKIIWNIRHSNLDPKYNKKLTLMINKICAKLSRKVDLIVYNGNESRNAHEKIGYCQSKGLVIDNGCDIDKYKRDNTCSEILRNELGIDIDKRIVLSVSKYSPIKDVPNFIRAFNLVHLAVPNTVAIMCGAGLVNDNPDLINLISKEQLILNKDIFFVGSRDDVERFMSICDLFVLHSAGEAFPNVLIQAMACECVCVSTNVGDVPRILSNDRFIVDPHNPEQLSSSMINALLLDLNNKNAISKKNRQIVEQNFNIEHISRQYESFYSG